MFSSEICERERCPVRHHWEATNERRLVLDDPHFGNQPIDMPLEVLLGETTTDAHRKEKALSRNLIPLSLIGASFDEAARLLCFPIQPWRTRPFS